MSTRSSPRTGAFPSSAILVMAGFTAVAWLIVVWFPATQRHIALDALQHKANTQASLIAYSIAPAVEFEDETVIGDLFRGAANDVDFIGVVAERADGSVVASLGTVGADQSARRIVAATRIDLQEVEDGTLRLAMSTARVDRQSQEHLGVAGGIGAVVLSLGLVVSVWVGRSIRRITHLVEESERAKHAAEQANDLKSRFLANMSHEIRTPLNGILGLSEVLLLRTSDPRAGSLLGASIRSARTLLRLVNDVLDLSRVESGSLELEEGTFDPESVAAAVCELFVATCAERGLSLALEVEPDLPAEVTGDRLRFEQILNNVTSNAIKFTERGGVVVALSSDAATGRLRAAVTDTGLGIAEEKREAIFDAFQQADTSTTRKSVALVSG